MNGNPVIVFPEFPDFSELEEDEIQNVLRYLSSIPRLASQPFSSTSFGLKTNDNLANL